MGEPGDNNPLGIDFKRFTFESDPDGEQLTQLGALIESFTPYKMIKGLKEGTRGRAGFVAAKGDKWGELIAEPPWGTLGALDFDTLAFVKR